MVKSTGMTRPLDSLGRIVIPKEMRISMGINVGDPLEIFIDSETNTLTFKIYTGMSCKMCGSAEQLTYFRGSFVCGECIHDMKNGTNCQKYSPDRLAPTQKNYRSEILLGKLKDLMKQHPAFSQQKYADILGVSQCRISQLKKQI
ncbi:UNVERIFIED_CONTAM: AbrB family looped-hinge helix DNA binding protein [Paenibacillus sp. PvR008]